jgi:hypothetical protein
MRSLEYGWGRDFARFWRTVPRHGAGIAAVPGANDSIVYGRAEVGGSQHIAIMVG